VLFLSLAWRCKLAITNSQVEIERIMVPGQVGARVAIMRGGVFAKYH
jgi:hypothetical protein